MILPSLPPKQTAAHGIKGTYIEKRLTKSHSDLTIKGPDANAYQYPHPKTLVLVDPKSRTAQANLQRVERPTVNWVFPDIHSGDPRYIDFLDDLSVEATRMWPATVDDDTGFVQGNAVRGNFYGLRHISGLPMTPATYTLASNKRRRKDAGLVNEVSTPWHRNLMMAWWIWAIDGIRPESIAIGETSSCFPEFTRDADRRRTIAEEAMRDAKSAGLLMAAGKFEQAWSEYQLGGAVYIVYRLQVTDKVTYDRQTKSYEAKGRQVATLEYALSSGASGELIYADKHKYVDDYFAEHGIRNKGFFACRKRTAAGGPWKLNVSIGVIADAIRANIYRKAPMSYHDRTRAQKTRDIREWEYLIAADVSDHDLLWPEFHLDNMCEAFRMCGFEDWWVQLFHRSMTLPQYVSSLSSEDGSTLIGEPFEKNLFSMLLSGNKFTDIAGTGGMSPIYAIAQIEHCAQHHIPEIERSLESAVDWIDAYLTHKLDIAQKSKSDDAFMLFNTPRVVAKAKTFQRNLVAADKNESDFVASDYMVIGYEHGGAFLGDLLWFGHDLDVKKATFIGNIMSFFNNKFAPEYSCLPRGDYPSLHAACAARLKSHRPFPGIAWQSALQVYGDTPLFAEAIALVNKLFLKHFDVDFVSYMEQLQKEDEVMLYKYIDWMAKQKLIHDTTASSGKERSFIDNEVLADPSKLRYKYDLQEVSPFVRDILLTSIPANSVATYFLSIVDSSTTAITTMEPLPSGETLPVVHVDVHSISNIWRQHVK